MIFESLWPLVFLAAIPAIIILYLLKPRGTDYRISSNLLWKKLFINEQSRTFFEKFVHNLLMYLQILIVLLLIVAFMSPFFQTNGTGGGRRILLIDSSGSMQHTGRSGKSRFEEAVELACEYVRASDNTAFSVLTTDASGTRLLALDSTDRDNLTKLLRSLSASDCGGELTQAQTVLDDLVLTQENPATLCVFTDGQGAASFDLLTGFSDVELYVTGEAVSNVSGDYLAFGPGSEEGTFDVMVSMTNHSDTSIAFDVSLLDEDGSILAVSPASLRAGENSICLFSDVRWAGESCQAYLSGFSFEDGSQDSLAADNTAYAVKKNADIPPALLVGGGNTFLEKAYQAVTGRVILKSEKDAGIGEGQITVYDAGTERSGEAERVLLFGTPENSTELLHNVTLTVTDCDLTVGLSDFVIGVNSAAVSRLPEWASPFLEYQGKCVGYYGEHMGKREVVVGFDIRESDFPLRAEFPIFLANALTYLSDNSWLAANVYYAGEKLQIQPWADLDRAETDTQTRKAGLYRIGEGEHEESYVVRFSSATESDGTQTAESTTGTGEVTRQQIRKTLRNIFLVLAILLLVAEWFLFVRQMRYRGKFYLIVRLALMAVLLLALFGIEIRRHSHSTATVFVVDLSNSNESHQDELSDYLRETVARMPGRNQYGIVTFGKNSLVDQFLTGESYFAGLMTAPDKTATNFEEALSRALSMLPGDAGGRIVVLTDGKETKGDVRNIAQALSTSGAQLLTLLYESEDSPDAYIENVDLPAYLHPGDLYSVTVLVESNYSADATISLYRGSTYAGGGSVYLNKGMNRFVFQQQVQDETVESLRVRVDAEGDTCPENDIYDAYSVVESAPKVLVISGLDTNAAEFSSVLTAAGCDFSLVSALNAPKDIDAMLEYKSIILVDTYIGDLPDGFLENLETYVKDYGCGFVCCGGTSSYALGGYRDTVLEKVLPVDMQLRSVNEVPSMAMVMVIDHSGSMLSSDSGSGPSNLDVAITAACAAVDNLRAEDYVGVLSFDDSFAWQVEIRKADDKEAIKNSIQTINSGGGTTIKPAVLEAYRQISRCDASVRHVLLLTDGMGETTNYQDVIAEYTKGGVTLSTVAVGDGSDTALLELLAKRCGGRYYYTDLSSNIPRIFAQEVFLGGDAYIQNGDISLAVRHGHELTKNLFEEGWPNLRGYIAASPKTASSSIIVSAQKEDPILTVWQYGLGRTAAWNSDVTGEWSGGYSGRSDYVALWKRIVDYTAGNVNLGEDSVRIVTAGEASLITYTTGDYDGKTQVLANVIAPDGTASEVSLHATAPGHYEASLDTEQPGLYHFNIRREDGGTITNYMTTAAAVQFSDEYKFNVSSASYLNFAEKYGSIISPEDNIWTRQSSRSLEKYSLTNWLLGLGLFLFLADIALRRFQYVPAWKLRKRTGGGERTTAGAAGSEDMAPGGAGAPAESPVPTEKKSSAGKQASGKSARKKKADAADSTLDTSQLLKKKDDRNL